MPIRLCKPPLKGWGVAGQLSFEQVSELVALKHLNPSIQCASDQYTFVEFWCSNEALILDEVLKLFPDIDFEE